MAAGEDNKQQALKEYPDKMLDNAEIEVKRGNY